MKANFKKFRERIEGVLGVSAESLCYSGHPDEPIPPLVTEDEVLDQIEAIFNEAMLELKLVNGYRGEHKRVAPSKYYSEKCACGFGTRIDQKLPTGFMGDHIRLANAKLKEAK